MIEKMTLARPYARAIFEIADQNRTQEKWLRVLENLAVISENSIVSSLLKDRTISGQDMAKIFIEISKKFLDDFSRNFILTLASHKRLELLPEIKVLYQKMCAEKENKVAVQFLSAIPLAEEQQRSFKELLEKYWAKTVEIHYEIDNNLIGGFVAKAGNYIIDASLKRQLANLKEAMGN